jgi:F0F1-type ATP synthase membrane subunit b/b'
MLILREYNKNNKIKNRYIITMSYKRRKTNKRRYLQKRKTRQTMRMYGGNLNEINPNEIITEEKKEEVPTVMSNLEDAGQLAVSSASTLAAKGIQSAAKAIGVDPKKSIKSNIKEMGYQVEDINNALNSPEGEQLKEEASKLLKESVDILQPSVEKALSVGNELLQKEIPIIGNMANEAVLMVPGAGQVIGALEEAGNVAQASEAAVKSLADLTTTGAEAVENLEEQKRKAQSLWGKVTGILNRVSTGVNKTVSNVISSAQYNVDKKGKEIVSNMNNTQPESQANNTQPESIGDGGALKKLHNEAQMVGGRVRKSQLEFLAPYVNRSQILRQYGGKWNTKYKRLKHRNVTRRR